MQSQGNDGLNNVYMQTGIIYYQTQDIVIPPRTEPDVCFFQSDLLSTAWEQKNFIVHLYFGMWTVRHLGDGPSVQTQNSFMFYIYLIHTARSRLYTILSVYLYFCYDLLYEVKPRSFLLVSILSVLKRFRILEPSGFSILRLGVFNLYHIVLSVCL